MANLRGQSTKGHSLIVEMGGIKEPTVNEKGEVTNQGGQFLTVQIDQSLKNPDKVKTGQSKADPYPFLNTKDEPSIKGDGSTYKNHQKFYSASQIEKIRENAKATTVNRNGKDVEVLGIKADLVQLGKGEGYLINTKNPIEATANPRFGKTVLDKQEAVVTAANEYSHSQREARTEALVNEAESQLNGKAAEAQPDMSNA